MALPFGAKGLPVAWQLKRRVPVGRIVECAKVLNLMSGFGPDYRTGFRPLGSITRSSLAEALALLGEMAEWFKAQTWKVCVGATLPSVRIRLSPPWRVNPIGDGTCLENS